MLQGENILILRISRELYHRCNVTIEYCNKYMAALFPILVHSLLQGKAWRKEPDTSPNDRMSCLFLSVYFARGLSMNSTWGYREDNKHMAFKLISLIDKGLNFHDWWKLRIWLMTNQ